MDIPFYYMEQISTVFSAKTDYKLVFFNLGLHGFQNDNHH